MSSISGGNRPLDAARTIDGLKKEAKTWLKHLRAGDIAARARLERALPDAPAEPRLRDVQFALARELGFAGWDLLKRQWNERTTATSKIGDRANWFLEHACIDPILTNGPAAQAEHRDAALRILARHPDVARANIHTAVVCGEIATVREILSAHPEAATERGGPIRERRRPERESQWTPLLHLCYARYSNNTTGENAVAIANLLLDNGANPNDFFEVGSHSSRYTALTGLVGGGEEVTPVHPQADALVRLLLDRGANPVDVQLFYNSSLGGTAFHWLDILYAHSELTGTTSEWAVAKWNPARGITVLDSLLPLAHEQQDEGRIAWLLAHGARADVFPKRTNSVGVLAADPFTVAALALDSEQAHRLMRQHPEYRESSKALFEAAARNRVDAVDFLLGLGIPVDVTDDSNQTALHVAASSDAFDVVRLLVSRGASLDIQESNWNNTPLDHAIYGNQTEMIELLASFSRDLYRLSWLGNLDRLEQLLKAEPELAKVQSAHNTPLMWLPGDEARALEIAQLLLSFGADASITDQNGKTAAHHAERRGQDDVAALLRAHM